MRIMVLLLCASLFMIQMISSSTCFALQQQQPQRLQQQQQQQQRRRLQRLQRRQQQRYEELEFRPSHVAFLDDNTATRTNTFLSSSSSSSSSSILCQTRSRSWLPKSATRDSSSTAGSSTALYMSASSSNNNDAAAAADDDDVDVNHDHSPFPKMTVAIVGSGAVGGYYGARLWEAGHDVTFHMRGDHYHQSKTKGLNVTSVRGDMYIPPEQLQASQDTNDMGTFDWVIVALKSSSLDVIPDLIYPLLHSNTRVILIMNGLIEEDIIAGLRAKQQQQTQQQTQDDNHSSSATDTKTTTTTTTIIDALPWTCCAAVYGGMALLCSNRIGPGHIDHSYAGLLSGGVAVSSCHISPEENKQAFQALWEPATNVDIAYEDSLLRGRWKKNVWNLPFNGISVAMGGITIDVVVNDPGLRALAYTIMDETIAIANADLKRAGYDESWFLGQEEIKLMMDLSDAMGPYKTSTMLDLVERRPMEVRYLFRKPLERAERLGMEAPQLKTLVTLIEAYQAMYQL